MSKSTKKLLKRIFWIISLVLVLIVVSGIALAYIYEAEVKQYAIAKINEKTKSKIKVEHIELSFLKRFPMAALQFHNVRIMEVTQVGEAGVLLKADDIFLKFNVIDLIQNKIVLKDVEINGSNLNLIVFKDGSDNFHIFKPNNDTDQSDFLLKLIQFSLNKAIIHYQNYATKQELVLEVGQIKLSGNFSAKSFHINLLGKTQIKSYRSEGYKMFEHKELKLDVDIAFNKMSKQFVLHKGNVIFNKTKLSISGNITKPKLGLLLDLKLKAPSLSLAQLVNTIPATYKTKFEGYKFEGLLSIDGTIKGLVVSHSVPQVTVKIGLKKASIESRSFDAKLDHINLQAVYTNGTKQSISSSSVHIPSFSFKMKSSSYKGQMQLNNFLHPKLMVEVNSDINLDELISFTGNVFGIQKLSGRANLNLKVIGAFSGLLGEEKLDFSGLNYQGEIEMKSANFKHQSSNAYYQDIVGKININGSRIHIEPSMITLNNHRHQISVDIRNFIPWSSDPENNSLHIRGQIKASKLSYTDIEQIIGKNKEDDGSYPNDVDLLLNFQADTFVWRKLNVHQASGVFILRNAVLSLQHTRFNTLEGQVNMDLSINGRSQKLNPVFCRGNLNNININKLFTVFNNFEQDVITNKNIKGHLTADFVLNYNFDKDWNIISKSIVLESNVIIRNGELNNIKELDALSKYTRIDDFSHIKFSTLENTIQIKDRKILIPDMLIKSNKLDIDLAGTHSFDNVYDYHIAVLMSDLMAKKAKEKSNNEFGEVENDGYGKTKLFFHIVGKGEDIQVKYDRKSLAKKLKNDMKEEGSDLKKALNKEFGWFKNSQEAQRNDSIKTSMEDKKEKENLKKQEEGEFIFEWNEEEEKETEEVPLII